MKAPSASESQRCGAPCGLSSMHARLSVPKPDSAVTRSEVFPRHSARKRIKFPECRFRTIRGYGPAQSLPSGTRGLEIPKITGLADEPACYFSFESEN
jgi:hypothetical protein